eukprot:7119675-Ditylum_brightwellii.AAC.1
MPQAPSDERLRPLKNSWRRNSEEIKFPCEMVYQCDATDPDSDLLLPVKALLNMDIMKVINYTYTIDQHTCEEQAKNLWEDVLVKKKIGQ